MIDKSAIDAIAALVEAKCTERTCTAPDGRLLLVHRSEDGGEEVEEFSPPRTIVPVHASIESFVSDLEDGDRVYANWTRGTAVRRGRVVAQLLPELKCETLKLLGILVPRGDGWMPFPEFVRWLRALPVPGALELAELLKNTEFMRKRETGAAYETRSVEARVGKELSAPPRTHHFEIEKPYADDDIEGSVCGSFIIDVDAEGESIRLVPKHVVEELHFDLGVVLTLSLLKEIKGCVVDVKLSHACLSDQATEGLLRI